MVDSNAPSGVERGILMVMGPMDFFDVGGRSLEIDEVCLFEGCPVLFPLEQPTPIFSNLGMQYVHDSSAPSLPGRLWAGRLGHTIRNLAGVPVRLESLTLPTLFLESENVNFTAQLSDSSGQVLFTASNTPTSPAIPGAPHSLTISVPPGIVLASNDPYQILVWHDQSSSVRVGTFSTSGGDWIEPALLFHVVGPLHTPDATVPPSLSSLRPIVPIELKTVPECQ